MATQIHPTAIIEDGAQLDDGVEVGAYAYVGRLAKLGANTKVHHHATVDGNTEVGRDCEIFPYALIGGKTQDLKYDGGDPGLKIGERNIFREYCSVHCATHEGSFTEVGSDNFFLAYIHIAHECKVGSHIVMSNSVALAGHVVVEDYAIIGGISGIHQFCRIGRHSFIGSSSKLAQDMPPYMLGDGNPLKVRSFNRVGLERRGFTPEAIKTVRQAYKLLYREGLNRSQAMEKLQVLEGDKEIIDTLVNFINSSERGIV